MLCDVPAGSTVCSRVAIHKNPAMSCVWSFAELWYFCDSVHVVRSRCLIFISILFDLFRWYNSDVCVRSFLPHDDIVHGVGHVYFEGTWCRMFSPLLYSPSGTQSVS